MEEQQFDQAMSELRHLIDIHSASNRSLWNGPMNEFSVPYGPLRCGTDPPVWVIREEFRGPNATLHDWLRYLALQLVKIDSALIVLGHGLTGDDDFLDYAMMAAVTLNNLEMLAYSEDGGAILVLRLEEAQTIALERIDRARAEYDPPSEPETTPNR